MASKETLTQFGSTFQSKVLSSLLSDNQFIGQISDILEPSFFESEPNQFLTQKYNGVFCRV